VKELEEIGRALAERTAERAALIPSIDEELVELYEDLRAQKKGVGAAALEDGVCQGCHQKLSPLELERIRRAEGIRRCEYCRRILVLV
jgi:predicted  nucleic acid-binding Zn-ribbon protein